MNDAEALHDWRTSKKRGAALDALLLRAAGEVQQAASLRFDAYGFLQRSYGLASDYSGWTDRWELLFRTGNGQLPAGDDEALSLAFLYQRYLNKWGGEHEQRHGFRHRLWRASVLRTIRVPTPPDWRLADYDHEWERHYRPHLDAAEACVREIHERMKYDDDAEAATDSSAPHPILRRRKKATG